MNALMIHSQMMIHSLPTLLLGFLIKNTFLLLAAWAVGCLLRRASAATRHLVWSAALGGVLLVPLLSLSLPQWKVTWGHVSAATPPTPMVAPQAPLLPLAPTHAPAVSQAAPPFAPAVNASLPVVAPVSRAVPVPPTGRQFSTFICTLGGGLYVWLIGLLSVLCQLFVGLSRLARIEHRGIPLEHGELQLAEDVRGRMGLRRSVRFLRVTEASTIAVPVTWGVFRPVVLLPAQSSAWSKDCLRAALLHELAHVQRWDWPTQLMGRLACALYWWHPLVWWAARQAREESERACDDLVLGMGMKAADYAQRLVEVVRSMPEGAPSGTVAIAMAQPSEVEGRVKAVLAKGKERGPVARRGVAVLAVVALVLLPLASLRMAVQAQQAGDGSILTGTIVPPVAVVTRNTRWALALISMRDVACPRFPDRPVTVRAVPDASGMQHYLFHDGRTGKDYRDSGQIRDDFARLLAQGSQPRPGAAAYPVPPTLAAMTRTYGRHLFFTSTQRAKASRLDQEAHGWAARDFDLVLADGDMEPKASAAAGPNGATVSDTLLPEGAGKLAEFERTHVGEYLGIVVGDSTLPRAVTLAGPSDARRIVVGGLTDVEASALADDVNVPSGTEVIGGGIQRATYPDGTIYEADEDEGQQASVVSGYSAVLPSGYTVEVTGITRAKRKNDKWVEGGLRWTPSGRPLPAAAPTTSNGWSWPVGVTGGLAPHFADVRITPPHGQPVTEPFSTYLSLGGTATVAWARTFQRWGDRTEAFYPQNGRPCSLRVGVAAGPWRTVASLPVHLNTRDLVPPLGGGPWPLEIKLDDRPALMYQDRQGHAHTEYFLPAGQRLGNVARRIVAVEVSGRTVVGSSWNSHPVATSHSVAVSDGRNSDVYPVATGIFDISFYGPLVSDVSRVREYRLETRPYQVVEFRNIQVKPPTRVQPQTKPTARTTVAGGSDTAAVHIALGEQLQQQGQPRDGIPEFRRAVQIDPNDAEAQYRLARALYEVNKRQVGDTAEKNPKPDPTTTMALSTASTSAPRTLLAQTFTKIPGPRAARHNLPSGAIAIPKASHSPPPPQISPPAADTGVTAAQEQLRRVTIGYRAGINSRGEVNVAATALAEARIRSAAARNEFTGLTPDLEAVVRNKQELLEETQMRYRAGASDTTTVNRAEEAVAEARVRADLYAVLKTRQSALSEIKALYRSGATSTQEVDKATAALQKAQHAFISNDSE